MQIVGGHYGHHHIYINFSEMVVIKKTNVGENILFTFAVLFSRASICVLLLRILSSVKIWTRMVYIALALDVVASIISIVTYAIYCAPIQKGWDPSVHGSCLAKVTIDKLNETVAAIYCAVDFMCAGIPFVTIRKVQMDRRIKALIIPLLMCGLLTAACSIGRLTSFHFDSKDPQCKCHLPQKGRQRACTYSISSSLCRGAESFVFHRHRISCRCRTGPQPRCMAPLSSQASPPYANSTPTYASSRRSAAPPPRRCRAAAAAASPLTFGHVSGPCPQSLHSTRAMGRSSRTQKAAASHAPPTSTLSSRTWILLRRVAGEGRRVGQRREGARNAADWAEKGYSVNVVGTSPKPSTCLE